MEEKKKMKAGLVYLPSSSKGRIILVMMIICTALIFSPCVEIINSFHIIGGLPALVTWDIVVSLIAIGILTLARKWGVK